MAFLTEERRFLVVSALSHPKRSSASDFHSDALGTQGKESVFWCWKSVDADGTGLVGGDGGVLANTLHQEIITHNHKKSRTCMINNLIEAMK